MVRLKQMSWNDNWENYIKYGKEDVSEEYEPNNHRDVDAQSLRQVLSVMTQLENKLPVYDAFLKGLEIYYSSTTCGRECFLQEYRRLQNKMYQNMKKGIVDEFLVDFHSVMIKASKKWCSMV